MNEEQETIRQNENLPPNGGAVVEADSVEKMTCQSCKTEMDVSGIPSFSEIKCPVCGMSNRVPAKLGHFTLLEPLGSGGMGTVFLAQDDNLGRKVAIKVMKKSLGDDPVFFENFRAEAQNAARLNHPHVAQVYSFGREKGLPYLEMELVNGSNLGKMISDGIKLDPAFVLRVGAEIAEGLKAAEEEGLYHGDIKPDNILFDENMQAKLVDFGIASIASQEQSDELWGTPYYIAPEKVQKKKNSARSDIYSLGATLYHAVAGRAPYEGPDAATVIKARFKGPPMPLERLRSDVEPEVARIISRMMYNDLFMRYPNYNSLINDINAYLARIPAARKAGPQPTAGRKMVISKDATSRTESETGASESTSRKSGKKLVIRKGATNVTTAPEVSDTQTAYTTASDSTEESNVPQTPRKQVDMAKVTFIIVASVVGLIVLGGVAGLIMMVLKRGQDAKIAAQNEQLLKEFDGKLYVLDEKLPVALDKMRRADCEMTNIFASLNKIYMDAVNIPVKLPDLEPPPEPEPEEPAPDDGFGDEANSPTDSDASIPAELFAKAEAGLKASGTKKPAPEQIAKVAKILLAANGENISVELISKAEKTLNAAGTKEPTPEQIVNLVKALMATEAKKTAADTAAAGEEATGEAADGEKGASSPDEAGSAEEQPKEPEVKITAEQQRAQQLDKKAEEFIYGHARAIRKNLRDAEKIADAERPDFTTFPGKLSPLQVSISLKEREDAYAATEGAIAEIGKMTEEANSFLKEMRRGLLKVRDCARVFIEERNRLAEEARIAAEKAKKESEERIAEAQRKAAADEEVNRVQGVLSEQTQHVTEFNYEKVISNMRRMEAELRTDEGKEELKWAIERYARLISLREFLLDDLAKHNGLKRGYRNQDIEAITPNRSELHLKSGRNVPIKELTINDWSRIIYGLLGNNRDPKRRISFTDRGTQRFNAAIFFHIHGMGSSSAEEAAKKFAKSGMETISALRMDAKKLLPILEDSDFPDLYGTSE